MTSVKKELPNHEFEIVDKKGETYYVGGNNPPISKETEKSNTNPNSDFLTIK